MYDVSARHRSLKDEAEAEIKELKEKDPDGYLKSIRFRELCEIIRQANRNIETYDRNIKRGVKY